MRLHLHAGEGLSNCHSFIVAGVVHQDHEVHDSLRHHLIISLAEGLRRVIRGHDNNNFLVLQH